MICTFSELFKVALRREGVSVAELAERLDVSRQNVNQRLLRDTFYYADMVKYADAIGYDVKVDLIKREEGGTDER